MSNGSNIIAKKKLNIKIKKKSLLQMLTSMFELYCGTNIDICITILKQLIF